MEGTEDGITLSINENGISCILSKYLPQYIAKNMGGYVESFLGMHNLQKSDMDFWAIHPGGRRIIEEAQNGLGLSEEQAKYSWNVLSNYGNMLSPSVMFVLELILNDHKKAWLRVKGIEAGIAFVLAGVGAEASSSRSSRRVPFFLFRPKIARIGPRHGRFSRRLRVKRVSGARTGRRALHPRTGRCSAPCSSPTGSSSRRTPSRPWSPPSALFVARPFSSARGSRGRRLL